MKKCLFCLLAAAVLLLTACTPQKQQDISMEDHCWQSVTNCQMEDQADGTVKVTLTAPDYVAIAKKLAQEGGGELTSEKIIQITEKYPEAVKEYRFDAASSEEAEVRSALMEQVAYELIAMTLIGVEE